MGKKKRMGIDGKTYEVTLDKFLADRELTRKSIAKDGSCLFRAVSEQVYDSQSHHQKVRLMCVEYISTHREDFKEFITIPFDRYLTHLSREGLWGGELELVAVSRLYHRSIVVYNEANKAVQEQVFLSSQDEDRGCNIEELHDPILLAYSDGNHYDSVFSTHYMDTLSFCQGLVYTCLMEKVFKFSISNNCKRRLKNLGESEASQLAKADRNSLSSVHNKDLLWLGRNFQHQEIVAMSWTLYHNAPLHVHRYEKRSIEQSDRSMAASIQFHVGNRCYFQIDGRRMNGEIAALYVTPECHLVLVYPKRQEKWEIPVKNITLASRKPRPHQHQQGEEPDQSKSSGGQRSRQQKEQVPVSSSNQVTSQSILGPVPSAPFGATKKGKVPSGQQQQPDRSQRQDSQRQDSQRQDSQRRKHGVNQSGGPGGSVEHTARQGHGSKAKPTAGKTASSSIKSDQRSAAAAGSNSGPHTPPPGPPPGPPPVPNPTMATPYSSVVKKTAGGPSGSLTSEGTEEDESSGEEVEEDSKTTAPPTSDAATAALTPVPSKPSHQDIKLSKSAPTVRQGKTSNPSLPQAQQQGRNRATGESGTSERKPVRTQFTVSHNHGPKYQAPAPTTDGVSSPEGRNTTTTSSTSSILSAKRQVESPYLERQLPQSSSSQPEDAWPIIEASHKEVPLAAIPSPEKTMLYAAAISNQNESVAPLRTVDDRSPFPASTVHDDKAHLTSPSAFKNQGLSTRVSSPPFTLQQYYHQPYSAHRGAQSAADAMMGTANLVPISSIALPFSSTRFSVTANQHHSFQQPNQLTATPSPSSHHHQQQQQQQQRRQLSPHLASGNFPAPGRVVGGSSSSTGEVYTNLPKASSTPQLEYGGGGSGNRSPRNIGSGLFPYTTVAASMQMRDMLGIEGGIQPAVQSSSASIHAVKSGSYQQSVPETRITSHWTQTPVVKAPETSDSAIQVEVEVVAREVQTQGPAQGDAPTQTEGCYVAVEELAPPEDVALASIAEQLKFAVQYSLQCLSAYSHQQGGDHSVQELQTYLSELLAGNQIEMLTSQAAQVSALTASQQDFLRSVSFGAAMPYQPENSSDHQPSSPADMSSSEHVTDAIGSEDVTPQQEQLHSPPILPRMDLGPPPAHHGFPLNFMMTPRPPPVMMPPPHPSMYFPFMPLPLHPPMSYMPLMPPIVPRQMPPPPMPPQGSEEEVTDEQGTYEAPDSAHHDSSLVQQSAGDELDPDPQPLPPPPPSPAKAHSSSEMVASVYPIPPSAMAQSDVSELCPPPEAGHRSPDRPSPEPPCTVPQDVGLPSPKAPVVKNEHMEAAALAIERGEVQLTSVPQPSPPRVQQQPQAQQSTAKGEASQSQQKKNTRKTSQHSASASGGTSGKSIATGGNQPGLPCRPSPSGAQGNPATTQGGGKTQQQTSGRRSHHGGSKKDGDGQKRYWSGRGGSSSRRSDQAEDRSPIGGSGETRKDASTKKYHRNNRTSRKHGNQADDHVGSNTITGASPKSDQDPSRNFGLRSASSSSNTGAPQDTIDFRWSVPSPSSNSPIDSSHLMANPTPAAPGDKEEETEWPDFSELHATGGRQLPAQVTGPPLVGPGGGVQDDEDAGDPFLPDPNCGGLFLARSSGRRVTTSHKH